MKLFLFAVLTLLVSCNRPLRRLSAAPLIPRPVSVTDGTGNFILTNASSIFTGSNTPELNQLANYLAEKLRPATGFDLPVMPNKKDAKVSGGIYLTLEKNNDLPNEEGYDLKIGDSGIVLTARQPAGLCRGMQTLLQLFPDDIAAASRQSTAWRIAAGTIRDYPAYPFRSAMLDVSRHFFGLNDVKKFIDLIAFYKMNTVHLHLSDDQGWRIEVKSWPNLAAYGGTTQVGGGKGGYYTQQQYADIVQYAARRYVTIIPEIDMPGHINAALASYAQLNCNDTAPPLYTKTDVGFSTLCVKKAITYQFVDDVVHALADMTPGPYLHLGGDESHATGKDDYIHFINDIQPIPKKYGKRMIGWEEVAQSDLDSSTIVQFWSDTAYANLAARKGAMMILSPAKKVYLDMKYDSTTVLGLDWAARIEIDSSYLWSLSQMVNGLPRKNILGVEAPLWTETLQTFNDIEYMVFPRLPGIAEIGWSPEQGKNWEEYKARLAQHGSRMKAMNINFYRSKQIPW